ncbi:MAG TPA: ATP-binding protein, partial [Candidatus Acidoferrum sp.]|nr:ATP-binding protein [Candidatus Acidoferrum sp.]
REVALEPLIARVAALETRIKVSVQPGPGVVFQADPDQLEQMLINLIRNAADAVLESSSVSGVKHPIEPGKVTVRWSAESLDVTLAIEDDGPGLSNPSNVFTPFYTTKPHGSGVGLVLSRQIAEAHGGSIEISNRPDRRGCMVKVVLPRSPARNTAMVGAL